MEPPSSSSSKRRRLDGWKAIGDHIGRNERTAKRWEQHGLPVHRPTGRGGRVYAFTDDVDAWMATEPPEIAAERAEQAVVAIPRWSFPVGIVVIAAVSALIVVGAL